MAASRTRLAAVPASITDPLHTDTKPDYENGAHKDEGQEGAESRHDRKAAGFKDNGGEHSSQPGEPNHGADFIEKSDDFTR